MVTVNALVKAINALIVQQYPEDPVYVNILPKGFKRPSSYIETIGVESESVGRWITRVKAEFLIHCYAPVGGHYESDTVWLGERLDGVLGLFAHGYMAVADRKLEVAEISGDINLDEAYVSLKFDFFDDRPEPESEYPPMETVETTIMTEE